MNPSDLYSYQPTISRKTAKRILTNKKALPLPEGDRQILILSVEQILSINESLYQQLVSQGKEDTFVAVVASNKDSEITTSNLPVFGDSNKWNTIWFKSLEKAVNNSLKLLKCQGIAVI